MNIKKCKRCNTKNIRFEILVSYNRAQKQDIFEYIVVCNNCNLRRKVKKNRTNYLIFSDGRAKLVKTKGYGHIKSQIALI